MERQHEEIATDEIGGDPKRLRLPSAWLAFYSCTLLLLGCTIFRLIWTDTTLFPIPTALLAFTAFAAGILLWFQKRVGLSLYIAIAFGIIAFAAYRFAFDGYTFGRVVMVISGLLMLAGYPSVAEELPMGGHNDPMGRSGGSADTEHKETKMSDEAQTRKDRSIAILKAEKVPFIEHLPPIEIEADSTRRTTEQVANRAMALCIVAVKGEGLEQEFIDKLIEKYALASAFTPEEKEFISNPKPTQHDRVQFAWRYECFWIMLWALGYIDELGRPDTICDVKRAVSILRVNGRDGFLKNAKLRPQSELLDAADLIYRYHWAVVDARVNQRDAPAGLDGGIVMERHHALNWIIGYMDQDWDDVSTDT